MWPQRKAFNTVRSSSHSDYLRDGYITLSVNKMQIETTAKDLNLRKLELYAAGNWA